MVVGNGRKPISSWMASGVVSLRDKFPNLYAICNEQNAKVCELAAKNWNITFRRWLDETEQGS